MEDEGLESDAYATAEAKWNALTQADRAAIGTRLWAVYNGHYRHGPPRHDGSGYWDLPRSLRRFLHDFFHRDLESIRKLIAGTLDWIGDWGSYGVSDLVEVLHFAGFTPNVEAIFDAYPAAFGPNDVRRWHTSPGGHYPVSTMATFR